jgi:hypothetical protein
LVSANTRFRKPAARLATFAGCKRRRRNARGPNATTRLAQLDHVLVRFRERSRVTNCDMMELLVVRSDHRLLHCDLHLKDPPLQATQAAAQALLRRPAGPWHTRPFRLCVRDRAGLLSGW